MPQEAYHNAYVLWLLNDIADEINGDNREDTTSRRSQWTCTSYHDQFFGEARSELKKMHVVDPQTKKRVRTDAPCLQNLVDTLQGFRMLWKKLQGLGFTTFSPRKLNQDPLENFFVNVKSHDFRSNKPTCFQFESIFKSLLLTNLTWKHAPGYNCEEDHGKFILSCADLIVEDTVEEDNDDEEDTEKSEHDKNEDEKSQIETQPVPKKGHIYCHSQDLMKSLQSALPSIKSCNDCFNSFQQPSVKTLRSTRFRDVHLDAKLYF